jgi:hypothetical protein
MRPVGCLKVEEEGERERILALAAWEKRYRECQGRKKAKQKDLTNLWYPVVFFLQSLILFVLELVHLRMCFSGEVYPGKYAFLSASLGVHSIKDRC